MALYYYDGTKFQKCLNTDTISGLPLDKRVEDLAFFLEPGGNVNTLLSELKVVETCFYDIEEVKKLLYVLTSRGWELILSEDMNVRPKGIHTRESILLNQGEPILSTIQEKYDGILVNISHTQCKDSCVVEIKTIPKANVSDLYNLTPEPILNSNNIGKGTSSVDFLNIVNSVVEEQFNHTSIEFNSQNNTNSVIIDIVPE